MPGFLRDKPDFHRGDLVSARKLTQIVAGIVRQLRGGAGVNVGEYGDRTTLSSDQIGPILPDVGNYIGQFVVLEEHDDYLLCTPLILPTSGIQGWIPQRYAEDFGMDATAVVPVAKPYNLQETPWNGKIVPESGHVPTEGFTRYYTISGGVRTVFSIPNEISLSGVATTGGSLAPATYYYYVTALINSVEVVITNQLRVKLISPNATINLTWSASGYGGSGIITGYNVYRSKVPNDMTSLRLIATLGLVTTYSDNGSAAEVNQQPTFLISTASSPAQYVQQIYPNYEVGGQITAVRAATGYVIDAPGGLLPITWQDLNVVARRWGYSMGVDAFSSVHTDNFIHTAPAQSHAAVGTTVLFRNPRYDPENCWDTGGYWRSYGSTDDDGDTFYIYQSGFYKIGFHFTQNIPGAITGGDLIARITAGSSDVSDHRINPVHAGTYTLDGVNTFNLDQGELVTLTLYDNLLPAGVGADVGNVEFWIELLAPGDRS